MNPTDHFETIVSEYYQPLFKFAMSLTHAESDAQDLTQQTFYIWATKGHQLRDVSKAKTWLFTTLHRTFLQARRRHRRFPYHVLEEISKQVPTVNPESYNRHDSAQVIAALASVDEIYRAAVALFYLQECSYKEIAAILEVPLGTVKSRIARGILALRKVLLTNESSSEIGDKVESRHSLSPAKSVSHQRPPFRKPSARPASGWFPGFFPRNGT